jgi:hypothetical protein
MHKNVDRHMHDPVLKHFSKKMVTCLEAGVTPSQQIRQPAGLRRMIGRLAGAWALDKIVKNNIRGMFSSSTTFMPVFDHEFQSEVCFSFWGFVPSDEARCKLLDFFFLCMQPRMYMTGQTRAGSVETIMIVRLDKMHIRRHDFETWLESFLSNLKMSAGVHIFMRYLDEPMVSCMQRIQGSSKVRSNIGTEWNKDLRMLYESLIRETCVKRSILAITGMQFTSENFVSLWHAQHSLSASQAPRDMSSQNLQSRGENRFRRAFRQGMAEALPVALPVAALPVAAVPEAQLAATLLAEPSRAAAIGAEPRLTDDYISIYGEYPQGAWFIEMSNGTEFRPMLLRRQQPGDDSTPTTNNSPLRQSAESRDAGRENSI